MNLHTINLLLADDDPDDCLIFKDALKELALPVALTVVHHGEELMKELILRAAPKHISQFPHILFLDLNMPRKNGFECLVEIKSNQKLQQLPVVIYSTSLSEEVVELAYNTGAHFYTRKPAGFEQLKSVVYQAITIITAGDLQQPTRNNFVLQSNLNSARP